MKKNAVRLLCVILCAALCLTFFGCEKRGDDNSAVNSGVNSGDLASSDEFALTLPYTSVDGFNPYISGNNLTLQNSALVFTKLVYIAPDFSLKNSAAKKIDNRELTVTVTVDTSLKFADGSAFSAQDAAASITAAMQSEVYGSRFSNIEEVTCPDGGDSVIITLKKPDSMFEYLLDIPMMKQDETAVNMPTASGRYTYGAGCLVKNPYYNGKITFDKIYLTELSGYDAISGALALGVIDFYTSEAETENYGLNVAHQAYFKMNNLVFVGINGQTYEGFDYAPTSQNFLKLADGRKAVCEIIDSQQIVEKAYYSRAAAASSVFNPAYPFVVNAEDTGLFLDIADAEKLMADMGFEKKLDGYYYDSHNSKLSLRLLCYSGSSYKRYVASLIANQLSSFGIDVITDEVDDFTQYTQKITNGDFDMYIGEVKLYNNMDISLFLSPEGTLNPYLSVSEQLTAAYESFLSNSGSYSAFVAAFKAETPYIPLLWRSGAVTYTKKLDGLSASISDPFYGLSDAVAV